ncbi:MAG TPA: ferredoxin [Acidimicrobiales bacterium]|nr:ferredoxin [Acidimicrobiales bacterium]
MRLVVDRDRCKGHAQCVLAAPHLLALDESRRSSLIDMARVDEYKDEARDAELLCPEFAITLLE